MPVHLRGSHDLPTFLPSTLFPRHILALAAGRDLDFPWMLMQSRHTNNCHDPLRFNTLLMVTPVPELGESIELEIRLFLRDSGEWKATARKVSNLANSDNYLGRKYGAPCDKIDSWDALASTLHWLETLQLCRGICPTPTIPNPPELLRRMKTAGKDGEVDLNLPGKPRVFHSSCGVIYEKGKHGPSGQCVNCRSLHQRLRNRRIYESKLGCNDPAELAKAKRKKKKDAVQKRLARRLQLLEGVKDTTEVKLTNGDAIDTLVEQVLEVKRARDVDGDDVVQAGIRVGAFEIAAEQLKLHRADLRGDRRIYTAGYIRFALALRHIIGRTKYSKWRLSNIVALPANQALDCHFDMEPIKHGISHTSVDGFLTAARQYLKDNNIDKQHLDALTDVQLAFDEVKLQGHFVWDQRSEQIIGAAHDIEEIDPTKADDQVARFATLVTLRSIPYSNFRYPLGIVGTRKEKAPAIRKKLDKILSTIETHRDKHMEPVTVTVKLVVCDGDSTHAKPVPEVCKDHGVQYLPDIPHVLKRMRNCLVHAHPAYPLHTPWGCASQAPLTKAWKNSQHFLSKTPKIGKGVVSPSAWGLMSVSTAVKLFSTRVTTVVEEGTDSHTNGVLGYLSYMRRFWEVFSDRRHLTASVFEQQKAVITDLLAELDDWESIVKAARSDGVQTASAPRTARRRPPRAAAAGVARTVALARGREVPIDDNDDGNDDDDDDEEKTQQRHVLPFLSDTLNSDLRVVFEYYPRFLSGAMRQYSHLPGVCLAPGKWTQDHCEHLFGSARSSCGDTRGVTLDALLKRLRVWQFDCKQGVDLDPRDPDAVFAAPITGNSGHLLSRKHHCLATLPATLPRQVKARKEEEMSCSTELPGADDYGYGWRDRFPKSAAEDPGSAVDWRQRSLTTSQMEVAYYVTGATCVKIKDRLRLAHHHPRNRKKTYVPRPHNLEKQFLDNAILHLQCPNDGKGPGASRFAKFTDRLELHPDALFRVTHSSFVNFFVPVFKRFDYALRDAVPVDVGALQFDILSTHVLYDLWCKEMPDRPAWLGADAYDRLLSKLYVEVVSSIYRNMIGGNVVPRLVNSIKGRASGGKGSVAFRTEVKALSLRAAARARAKRKRKVQSSRPSSPSPRTPLGPQQKKRRRSSLRTSAQATSPGTPQEQCRGVVGAASDGVVGAASGGVAPSRARGRKRPSPSAPEPRPSPSNRCTPVPQKRTPPPPTGTSVSKRSGRTRHLTNRMLEMAHPPFVG
eukprot:TRINITY_DN198_c0_g1_i1.p1 TRINITY_DN198_c0_g1~~TRINITY_DN198_c0_g1_i1.p1  ORF type:complete len:1241 (-),score=189.78 TRINITY_DN198_c0_g1_i1:51-3773(-)